MFKSIVKAAALCSILFVSAASAWAEDIVIEMDKTQLLTVSVAPTTIVVGNPSIADVTVNGSQVFLQGTSYGTTNVVMLDSNGSQIASLNVSVKPAQNNGAVVYSAGMRKTFNCAPTCETTLTPGDSEVFFDDILKQMQDKRAVALGIQPQRYSGNTVQGVPAQSGAPATSAQ